MKVAPTSSRKPRRSKVTTAAKPSRSRVAEERKLDAVINAMRRLSRSGLAGIDPVAFQRRIRNGEGTGR